MVRKGKITTRSMIMTGMFTAVLAVLSQIVIPMPTGVPVTLQTFAVALTGAVLGGKMGAAAACLYMLLGAVGVPVFSEMSGGLGILLGKTGGFIFGFIFMAALCGVGAAQRNRAAAGILGMAGLAICHILGIAQFMALTQMGFAEAAVLVSIPYLVKDAVSVGLAFWVGAVLRKSLYAANILTYEEKA